MVEVGVWVIVAVAVTVIIYIVVTIRVAIYFQVIVTRWKIFVDIFIK